MRGEERLCVNLRLDVLNDGPGDGESVEGCGAPADFVQHDQAPGRCRIQDYRGLGHLYHERRSPACQVVRRSNSSEDAIHEWKLHHLCGYEGSHLRHDHKQRRLPQKRGLSSHVRSRENQDPIGRIIHVEIIRHKAIRAMLLRESFDDGMAALVDGKLVPRSDLRTDITVVPGSQCEGRENIEFRDHRRALSNAACFTRNAVADLLEELLFDLQHPLLRGENLPFVFLQFRS